MEDRHTIADELALKSSMCDASGRQVSFFYDASVCDSYATFRTAVETAAKKGKVPVPSVICRMPNPGLGMMISTKWLDEMESLGLLEGDRPQMLCDPPPRQVRTKLEDGT